MFNYLKEKWKLNNIFQVVAILVVFALSGSTVLYLRPFIFDLLGEGVQAHLLLKIMCYVLFIFPLYQILLLGYGWVFGQQAFFLAKMKRLFNKLYSKKNVSRNGHN